MAKQDHINDLIRIAFLFDDKCQKGDEKSKDLQTLAQLAREGKQNTGEFKTLEMKHRATVIDYSNEVKEIRNVVKKLRKYEK